jgi:hypothetical protein
MRSIHKTEAIIFVRDELNDLHELGDSWKTRWEKLTGVRPSMKKGKPGRCRGKTARSMLSFSDSMGSGRVQNNQNNLVESKPLINSLRNRKVYNPVESPSIVEEITHGQ